MIKSMTGYGSAKGSAEGFEIAVELKSVNNRYLDTSIRMPRGFLFAEEAVKNAVQKHISRGKVDVFVTITPSNDSEIRICINEPLLKGYLDAVNSVSDKYDLHNDITALSAVRFPDVLSVEKEEMDTEALSDGIKTVTEAALADFDTMRLREGEKLRNDVVSRLGTIDQLVSVVERESPKTVQEYRKRLEQKMADVLGTAGIDENRILAEAAIFADHIATDEETVRLRSHMSQLQTMITGNSPIGRKIDFLVQEFNREANTIGSKCQNSDIAHVVVDLKSEIEKIREQIQNIE